MHLTIIKVLTLMLLVAPVAVFAHDNHPTGSPVHPIDSPDYHEVDTVTAPTAIAAPVSSENDSQIALLLQLIELLQQQLATLLGQTNVSDVTVDVEVVSTAATGEIVASGNLEMKTDATYRYFTSNSLPDYTIIGDNFATEESAQDIDVKVPLNPVMNEEPTYGTLPWSFGIALNGVMFEPFAAEWYQDDRDSGWQEDPFVTLRGFDNSNAHVQPTGLYHYHGVPEQLLEARGDDGDSHSPIVAFASDGFPVYGHHLYEDAEDATSDIVTFVSSYDLKDGTRPDGPGGSYDGTYNEDYEYVGGDLDECNGRYGVTPEFSDGTYYYVLTDDFPYIPRCLMGDQDSSFVTGPGSGEGPR